MDWHLILPEAAGMARSMRVAEMTVKQCSPNEMVPAISTHIFQGESISE